MPHPHAHQIDATCIHCENCVVVCPTDSISMGVRHFVIDIDSCQGCAICVKVCPSHSIHPVHLPKTDAAEPKERKI